MSFLWSFGAKKETVVPNVVSPTPSQQSFKAMSNAFRKGVQYNIKIVLRGDVMTGKSNLFHRLQGSEFDENYTCTPQIQVANIPWQYKDSNDIVKIEIWDVVDKAKNKSKKSDSIKLEHTPIESEISISPPPPPPPLIETEEMRLDASTVNVYRNTHGVIFLFDTTKPWTFDYVNNGLANVPETMAVLILGNFSDKTQDRKVELDTIHATLYQHNQDRIKKGAIKPNLIRYAESSMQTGLGLKYIYEYLGVPFLQLTIEALNKQLELKAVEIVDLLETLDINNDVPENMQRRRGQDNFNQPSEPHLARQQEELKSAWDKELQDIALDHPTILLDSNSTKLEEVPNADFNDNDELNDDWFGDDTPSSLDFIKNNKVDSDDEIIGPGNPMVAGDEDVEPVILEYYNNKKEEDSKQQQAYIKEKETLIVESSYQPPIFKSELNDVWSHSLRRLSGPEIVSDSEDEDNRQGGVESPSFNFGTGDGGGYEEIGGSSENPWSIGHEEKVWNSDANEDTVSIQSAIYQEPKELQAPPKKKKSSSLKKNSSKKKSPSSK